MSLAFHFDWTDADGKPHRATCDDWETAAMFHSWEKRMGTGAALDGMAQVFNKRYPAKGLAFAMGTVAADQLFKLGQAHRMHAALELGRSVLERQRDHSSRFEQGDQLAHRPWPVGRREVHPHRAEQDQVE